MSNQPEEFSNPGNSNPEESQTSNDTGSQGFEPPTSEDTVEQQAKQDLQEALADVDTDLLALKDEIAKNLMTSAQEAGNSNIVGVGIGLPSPDAMVAGLCANPSPDKLSLNVYTLDQVSMDQVLSEVSSMTGVRALSEVPINEIPCGFIDALNKRARIRPAPGGVSVGHFAITAGTLGCLCTGIRPPRSSRLMILSNNHVLANSNNAKAGDCICQPGPADRGRCPADQIAILEQWVRIDFAGRCNYVDAATGWAWPDRVRRELMYESGGRDIYFRVGSNPVAPAVNMIVGKTGRTTNLTQGRIVDISATIRVNFGGGRVALFCDQLGIVSTSSSAFSAGGDSGSLIWQWTSGLPPVGLLFAGGGGYTFANKIQRVLPALDIRLYT